MKQLDKLPPSDDLDDDDDYDVMGSDPFRERWHHRVFGTGFWLFDAVRFWLVWPVVSIGHVLGFAMATLGMRWAMLMDRLMRIWHRFWFHAIEFLQIEGMRRSVHELQDKAARSVDDVRHRIEDQTVRSSWFRSALERLHSLRVKAVVRWYDFLESARQSPLTNLITLPLRWCTHAGFAISDFATGWLFTRNYRHLLFGIPAMLMMLPLGYCAVRLPFHTDAVKIKHYRRAADAAIAAEDFESAELYFRKLRQLGGEHDQMIFRAALLAEEKGDLATAFAEMRRIAPLDEPGHLNAHAWIAQALSSKKFALESDAETLRVMESHVRHAITLSPDEASFRFWLAELLLGSDRKEEAVRTLESVNPKQLGWRTRALMADLYLRLGHNQEARDTALPVARHFQSQAKDEQRLSVDDYLSWAAALEIAGHVGEAIDVLVAGVDQHPDASALRSTAHQVGLAHFDHVQPRTARELELKLQVLNMLFDIGVDPTTVLDRAVRLYSLPGARETVAHILQQYRKEHGTFPPKTLRLLGDVSLTNGKKSTAVKYYAAAYKADNQQHAAANNLAVIYSQNDQYLDDALRLANAAITVQPENPHYLETRGQIYVKRKQWREAIADLHRALNAMPNNPKIHASLAQAYEATGQAEAARLHRQQADRLTPK